jgi:O-antigen/teichoic acid export membrane protein
VQEDCGISTGIAAINTARVAKNTLMLYFRQILIMLVSLYTVRTVLNTLGAEDYGIYNVVAGVVAMFGFLSNSMAGASQRYFAIELGRKDSEQLKKTFSLNLLIYIMIASAMLLLAETIGLWFVNNKLVIPSERMEVALWVYQFSIISFVFTIMATPYMAMIIAHEEMQIYAYLSIIEAVLKLIIVVLLRYMTYDKLLLYGILLCGTTMITTMGYHIICVVKYQECRFKFYWNYSLLKIIASYTGLSVFVSIAGICKMQGVTVLLNQYFNPIVVSSRSLAIAINSMVSSFFSNFSNALRPQIVKSYAAGRINEMIYVLFWGVKITYLLMYLFTLPLLLETPVIFSLWLKETPDYTIIFVRLVLIDALVESIAYPIYSVIMAIGRMGGYTFWISVLTFLNIIFSWIALSSGYPPESVQYIAVLLTAILIVVRIFILKSCIPFSVMDFIKNSLFPIVMITIVSSILPIAVFFLLKKDITTMFIVVITSTISICVSSYFIGFNNGERQTIKNIVKSKFKAYVS